VTVLQETFKHEITIKRLILFHTDVRTLDVQSTTLARVGIVSGKYKVVANIPYYLSGHLFRTFLESENQPSDIVFLVQKEVAERIARDKKESLLSLSVKVYGDPLYIKTIGRGNFTPPPKVDSAVIAIRNIGKGRLKELSETDFFAHIHAGFASRRKQLLGNLSLHYPRETLVHIFSTLGIREDVRGEDLHLDSWLKLSKHILLLKDETIL
jgi:16S rRNA (adenine1518-N6/adenine1519-N6)-dimethyltransferase